MFELSIVIPVYKIRDYIVRCVKSITDQLDDRVQVIVVDDGSPDDSIDLISDLCSKYENVEIHRKENGGLSSARNFGVEKARGKYLYFVDGDDFLVAGSLKDIVDELERGACNCYAFKHMTIEEMGGISLEEEKAELTLIPTKAYLNAYRNPITNVWKVVVLRQLVLKENLYFRPHVYCEDLEWLTKLFLLVNEVGWIDRHVYVYDHSRSDSIMNSLSVKRIVDLDRNIAYTKNLVDALDDEEKRISLKKLLFIEWCTNLSFYAMLSKEEKKQVEIYDCFSRDRDHKLFIVFGGFMGMLRLDLIARGLYVLKVLRKKVKRFNFMNVIKKQIMD